MIKSFVSSILIKNNIPIIKEKEFYILYTAAFGSGYSFENFQKIKFKYKIFIFTDQKQFLKLNNKKFHVYLINSTLQKSLLNRIFKFLPHKIFPNVKNTTYFDTKKFPNKKVEIFSSDTMNKKDSISKLDKIINNEIHILVGTQLISKGFHFPNLNCIVVVDIDLSSQGHDLRGAEKNLQLYHQLSGRAGRTGKPATVYFQTHNHNKNMISEITNKNPDLFLQRELDIRKKNKLPPYQRFISLILTSENQKKLEMEAFKFKDYLKNKVQANILGPVDAPLFRLNKKFRIRFLIRGSKSMKLQDSIANAIPNYKFSSGIKLSVDVDPINFN